MDRTSSFPQVHLDWLKFRNTFRKVITLIKECRIAPCGHPLRTTPMVPLSRLDRRDFRKNDTPSYGALYFAIQYGLPCYTVWDIYDTHAWVLYHADGRCDYLYRFRQKRVLSDRIALSPVDLPTQCCWMISGLPPWQSVNENYHRIRCREKSPSSRNPVGETATVDYFAQFRRTTGEYKHRGEECGA